MLKKTDAATCGDTFLADQHIDADVVYIIFFNLVQMRGVFEHVFLGGDLPVDLCI